ncbi:MAG: hypothetical protein HFH80_06985 [Lachnospiraceae bacterium]|nr:hypothetical protein [Lachnospiraceae bacterium]
MTSLERKTKEIVLEPKEVIRSVLQRPKRISPSDFLCMEDNRSSTINLPYEARKEFYVEVKADDIDF